ncbi:MAG: endonuclease/exonuclease/phosphatase family protein [Opitutaceae bacterium]|nr:endonuclease/exonuclease/phosphatase family protein [Opitutaceae bacterium]
MSKLPAAVSLLCALCVSAERLPAAASPAPIRVLTFNILASQPSWEVNAKRDVWEKRRPVAVGLMLRPAGGAYDFIGTQETATHDRPELHQARQLAAGMTGYGSLYAPCDGPSHESKFSLTNMIFWRKDRWEIDAKEQGTFWLSDTPEIPGSNTWSPVDEKTGKRTNKGGRRNVTWGLFHEIADGRRTGRRVYFFNTHLNVFVPAARAKSAFLILGRIHGRADKTAPIILTGDFNSKRDSLVYQYLTGSAVDFEGGRRTPPLALAEAFAAANPDAAYKPPIDFIFASEGLKAASARVIDVARGSVQPSDHRPVEGVLEWR